MNQHQGLRVYPNPSNDIINFSTLSKYASVELILLYDLQGKILVEARNTNNLNIAHLPAGVYYYEVVIDDMMLPSQRNYPVRGKVIKQ